MLYKGRIVKIRHRDAVVLSDGLYRKVRRKPGMDLAGEIYFTDEDIAVSRSGRTAILAAAAIVLLFLGSMLSPAGLFSPASPAVAAAWISVDANPSLEIEVAADLTVIGLRPLDERTGDLLDPAWNGRPLPEVLDQFIGRLREAGYLGDDAALLLGYSVREDSEESEDLARQLEGVLEGPAQAVSRSLVLPVLPEKAAAARERGLSLGRYGLLTEEETDQGDEEPGIPPRVEEFRNARVGELLARRDERLAGRPQGPPHGEEDHPGPPWLDNGSPADREPEGDVPVGEPGEPEDEEERNHGLTPPGPPEDVPGRKPER